MPSNILGVVPHGVYLAQYNGYTFDPAVTRTESIRSVPEWDTARRTIKFMRTTVHFAWHVFLPPTTGTIDATMDALKQRLESPGGAFYYREKGFGDFNINVPGGQKKDVTWGPHPGEFTAKPVADAYCWECTWSVEVCIPWCDAAKFENGIVEWNYQWYSDKDDGGYETRRIVGHIEIAMTRTAQGDRLVRASADDYREVIQPRCPPFFRPTISYFNLSEDRRTLTFNFSFEQFPGLIPPPGVLKVDISSTNSNEEPTNLCKWQWTLSGQYELVYGVSQTVAWEHFQFVRDQLADQIRTDVADGKLADPNSMQNNGAAMKAEQNKDTWLDKNSPAWRYGKAKIKQIKKEEFGKPADQPKNALEIIPISFTGVNPNFYGKPKCNFTIVHRVVATHFTLLTAGLWGEFFGKDDWVGWYKKAAVAFGPRGISGSRFNPQDDVIIDLCRQVPITSKMAANRPNTVKVRSLSGKLREVDAETTWLDLKVDLEFLQADSVMVHKPLPRDRSIVARRGGATLATPGALAGALAKFIPPEDSSASGWQYGGEASKENISTVARQAASTYTVVMYGEALRLGIPPDTFELVSIGGVPAVVANDPELGDGYRVTTVGNYGAPLFLSVWQFRYVLPCAPGSRPIDADTGTPTALPTTKPNTDFGNSTNFQTTPFTGSAPQWGMRRY